MAARVRVGGVAEAEIVDELDALRRAVAKERAALASERRVEEMRLRELIAHATKTVSDAEEAEAHRRALDARASGPRRWRRATDLEPDRVTTETRGKALLACDARATAARRWRVLL